MAPVASAVLALGVSDAFASWRGDSSFVKEVELPVASPLTLNRTETTSSAYSVSSARTR
ncbi:Uncharacterised protein [Mycobacterium tuberculosis]|nr:Uncharacterised protein [Mycobacterium tuberculosis]